jgi:DNA repair exonuclease SbcCD ATPase subunit
MSTGQETRETEAERLERAVRNLTVIATRLTDTVENLAHIAKLQQQRLKKAEARLSALDSEMHPTDPILRAYEGSE